MTAPTVLDLAAAGDLDGVKDAHANGEDIHAVDSNGFNIADHFALSNHLDGFTWASQQGVKTSHVRPEGTPAHFFASHNNAQAVQECAQMGIDMTVKNQDGFTAHDLLS